MTGDLPRLRRLLKDTRRLERAVSGGSFTAQPGAEHAIAYVASWIRHIDATISVIRYAEQKNRTIVVAPLQRLMVEHAVAAAMLANDPQSWEAYLRHSTDGARKLRKLLVEGGKVVPEDLSTFIEHGLEEEAQPYKRFRKIRQRFESLDESGENFYHLWLEATQLSHAGAPTAFMFLRETPNDRWPTVTADPQMHFPREELYLTCIESLLWAQDSFSSMLVDDPLREQIEHLTRRRENLPCSLRAPDSAEADVTGKGNQE